MEKDYSSQDFVTTVCTLYHSLQLYENDAPAFIHARDKGIEVGFNYSQKRVKDLIAKVEEVEGLKNKPIFKNCIDKLILIYDLENLEK